MPYHTQGPVALGLPYTEPYHTMSHKQNLQPSSIYFFPSAACFLCLQRWSKLHSWRRWARSTSKTKTLQAEPNLPIPFKYVGWNVSFQTNQLEFVEVCHRFVFPGCKLPLVTLVKIFISCIWAFFPHTYTWQRKQGLHQHRQNRCNFWRSTSRDAWRLSSTKPPIAVLYPI